MHQDREQHALARAPSSFAPRGVAGQAIRARARIIFAAALFAPACTLPTDVSEANQTSTQAQEEDIVDVTIKIEHPGRPCSGCAERDQLIASASAQASREAMAEAEARARELRRLNETRIRGCISTREAAVDVCNAAMNRIAAGAAATRATCDRASPCSAGDPFRIDTCINQGVTVCDDHLNSCIASIPLGAPGIEASVIFNAFAACNGEFGLPCLSTVVPRNCKGANNFGGFGSTEGLCSDFHHTICVEPENTAIAQALQGLADCVGLAAANESLCLGNPTAEQM